MILVKPIAVFRMADDKGRDEKILCVPRDDPNWNVFEQLEDLPRQLRDEIEHFFSIYKIPEGKTVTVERLVRQGRRARDHRQGRRDYLQGCGRQLAGRVDRAAPRSR